MTEIEREFHKDCFSKKNVARSARNKRTHTGKGGRVRLPHDNLTKKELEKMNGELKVYRLNDPMTWEEFKAMPDEHKVSYIQSLREKFGANTEQIADMLGVTTWTLGGKVLRPLGISDPKGIRRKLNEEAWNVWLGKAKDEPLAEENPAEECVPVAETPNPVEDTCVPDENRPDWEAMYKAVHARCCELHEQNLALRREVDKLREENTTLLDRCGEKMVGWDFHRKIVDALEKDNEILRAKMSVVDMIFGKR